MLAVATEAVGRVAIVGHYPLVFPVNFAIDEKSILYRTGSGTNLHSVHRSNVTSEADNSDPIHRGGSSVMVKGVPQELNVDRHIPTARQAPLQDPRMVDSSGKDKASIGCESRHP